jgi:hypothetical protein
MRQASIVCNSYLLTLVMLLAIASLPLRAGRTQSTDLRENKEVVPRFEDYKVAETWQGPNTEIKLTSHSKRMFRTTLRAAVTRPADFAGHYRFVAWGCGTLCEAGAIIDLKTGEVLQPPLAGKKEGWEHWIFCVSMYDKAGTEYRRDSSLFIVRCGGNADEHANNTPDVYYFVLEQGHFHLLLHIPASGKFSL